MRADQHELPTPRTTLRTGYVRVRVWCKSCRRQRDADLQALVDAGRGDVPLVEMRFRCSNCGSRITVRRSASAGRRSVSAVSARRSVTSARSHRAT
jgi:Zn finger protein HypA/HybF involved in hydrogenase expression